MFCRSSICVALIVASPLTAAASDCYDHYNPESWEGKGTSIVFCRNHSDNSRDSFINSCEIRHHNGAKVQSLKRHGNLDKGRVIYTDYNTTGASFNFDIDIVCTTKGGLTLTFVVGNGASHHDGCCRNKQCGSVACCGNDCSGGTTPPPPVDAGPPVSGDLGPLPACTGIAANPGYELCGGSASSCSGVFKDGSGCVAFCEAAGMVCTAHHGGGAGCIKESSSFGCAENTGNNSDWCECAASPTPQPQKDAAVSDYVSPPVEPDTMPILPDSQPPPSTDSGSAPSHDGYSSNNRSPEPPESSPGSVADAGAGHRTGGGAAAEITGGCAVSRQHVGGILPLALALLAFGLRRQG